VLQDKPHTRVRTALTLLFGLTRRAVKFISKHAATLIAIASLAIATFSLQLTIQSQKEDRAYKELMIRPDLQIGVSTDDFSIWFENHGLGPAKVKDVAYRIGNDCISLMDSHDVSVTKIVRVFSDVRARILGDVLDAATSNTQIVDEINPVVPGTVISVGNRVAFFRVTEQSLEALHEKINEWGPTLAKNLREKFLAQAMRIPIAMAYCFMSGMYCEHAGPSAKNCLLGD
jgi:hypothetical protein